MNSAASKEELANEIRHRFASVDDFATCDTDSDTEMICEIYQDTVNGTKYIICTLDNQVFSVAKEIDLDKERDLL